MTGDDFRRLALALHGASEGAHMKHPDFRAAGRIFASLDAGEQRGMAKLSPDEQREFLREYPDVFYPAAGAWGRQGCTMINLAAAGEAAVRGALSLAWEGVAARKAPAKKTPARKAPVKKATVQKARNGSAQKKKKQTY